MLAKKIKNKKFTPNDKQKSSKWNFHDRKHDMQFASFFLSFFLLASHLMLIQKVISNKVYTVKNFQGNETFIF